MQLDLPPGASQVQNRVYLQAKAKNKKGPAVEKLLAQGCVRESDYVFRLPDLIVGDVDTPQQLSDNLLEHHVLPDEQPQEHSQDTSDLLSETELFHDETPLDH